MMDFDSPIYFYYCGKKIIACDFQPAIGYFCRDFDFFERVYLSMQCPRSGVYWCSVALSDRALFKLFKRKGLNKCVQNYRHVSPAELPEGLQV